MIGLAKLALGAGNVVLGERPERDPVSGEVVLEVCGTGICGTDLHIEAGEFPSVPPVTMGHEISGVVAALGPDVEPDWHGVRVVTETFFSTCGSCDRCREGRPNLCAQRRSIGTHVDGGFAPRVVVPVRNLHRVPDWLDEHAAAMFEPLACVCNCMFDPIAVAPGERVLVTGPGPVGILGAQVARALGGEVLVAGLPADASRLVLARALGFATTDGDLVGAEPFDVAVEASGAGPAIGMCLRALRRGGRFVQVGLVGRPVMVPFDLLLEKEIELSTGFAAPPRAWRRALALVRRRDVELSPLVSDVLALSAWADAFGALRAGQRMKIVLDPRLA